MSWLRQVRCGGMRLNMSDEYCNISNNKYNHIKMNGSKVDCSCHHHHHKQSHCNRLTCYRRNGKVNGSSSCKVAMPSTIFITLAILILAMPLIDAAALKRSIAETSTTSNTTTDNNVANEIELSTANTPYIHHEKQVTTTNITTQATIIDEVNLTTANTPTLANIQTTAKNSTDTEVVIVDEQQMDTVKPNTNQTIATNMPEDVNNEIHNHQHGGGVLSEDIATEVITSDLIKPKFEYTETLLGGNLEETIRNSVKNEIEFEHEIGAAAIEHLQEITVPEERQKLSEEILAIPTALQLSGGSDVNANETVDVLTPLTSIKSVTDTHQQAPTTERTATILSSTITNDLSIYFPAKIEEQPIKKQIIVENQRDARNLNEKSEETLEILNESENKKSDLTEKAEIQNIEEEREMSLNELYSENENSATTFSTQESANQITEEAKEDKPAENIDEENYLKEDISSVDGERKENDQSDLNESVVTHEQENELSIVMNENLNSTLENIENEAEVSDVTPAEAEEASLSIVLDENHTETVPIEIVEYDSKLKELLNSIDIDAIKNEELYTTIEPETVKNVHIVIKKEGVELDEKLSGEETTTLFYHEDNETQVDENKSDVEAISKPTIAASVDSKSHEDMQVEQNDDVKTATKYDVENVTEINSSENVEPIVDRGHQANFNDNEHNIPDTTDPSSNELDAQFATIDFDVPDGESQNNLLTHNDHNNNYTEDITKTQQLINMNADEATKETIKVSEEIIEDNDDNISTTEISININFSLSNTTQTLDIVEPQTTTTTKEFITYDDNTDDPDIVPILVGVSALGPSDVTASTKGSRSINTQTHHSMLLTQMDNKMAATLFETFPPQNAGQMFNDHLAAESNGHIGKPLHHASSIGEEVSSSTSASIFSGSGFIIVLCASMAFVFLLASIVAFIISFQRQRGTLDIEMQEQRCGKDNLDDDEGEGVEKVGVCTKLLEIELPKSTIVAITNEELEECL